MEKQKRKEVQKETVVKLAMFAISILLCIPSILYLLKHKTVYRYIWMYSYTGEYVQNTIVNVAIFIVLFAVFSMAYYMIVKNHSKMFKNIKRMWAFILIVAICFTCIIPCTSSDVYSYIANGWVDSHYEQNPYETSVQEVINENGMDTMFGKVARCWLPEPVVYGPAFSVLCKVLSGISFGNIDMALLIFKVASLLSFLGCTLLIYKITKKRFFTLLFALNPLILFEALSNVHNDIFLILFILLAIYFLKNKQNIFWCVCFLAIATAMKYVSILLLPFFILYGVRKEKLGVKIGKSLLYGLAFIAIICLFYGIYLRNFGVLSGIFIQQNKYSRSIFLMLWYALEGKEDVLGMIKIGLLAIFAIWYAVVVIRMLISKEEIRFSQMMRKVSPFLWIFTFVLITNFNSWYLMWLFPIVMWQKAKNIYFTVAISIGGIMAYSISYATIKDDETVRYTIFFNYDIYSFSYLFCN